MIWILFGKQVFNVASYLVTELLEGSLSVEVFQHESFDLSALLTHFQNTTFFEGPTDFFDMTKILWDQFAESAKGLW